MCTNPASTTLWPNAVVMLAHRLRRWPNITTTLGQRLLFAGFLRCTRDVDPMFVLMLG